jgi:hypothetical protein
MSWNVFVPSSGFRALDFLFEFFTRRLPLSLVGVCVCWLPEDRHFFMLCLLKFDAIGIEIPSLLLGSINSKQFACKADQDIGATVSDRESDSGFIFIGFLLN